MAGAAPLLPNARQEPALFAISTGKKKHVFPREFDLFRTTHHTKTQHVTKKQGSTLCMRDM
jgi:hypothetical protein